MLTLLERDGGLERVNRVQHALVPDLRAAGQARVSLWKRAGEEGRTMRERARRTSLLDTSEMTWPMNWAAILPLVCFLSAQVGEAVGSRATSASPAEARSDQTGDPPRSGSEFRKRLLLASYAIRKRASRARSLKDAISWADFGASAHAGLCPPNAARLHLLHKLSSTTLTGYESAKKEMRRRDDEAARARSARPARPRLLERPAHVAGE